MSRRFVARMKIRCWHQNHVLKVFLGIFNEVRGAFAFIANTYNRFGVSFGSIFVNHFKHSLGVLGQQTAVRHHNQIKDCCLVRCKSVCNVSDVMYQSSPRPSFDGRVQLSNSEFLPIYSLRIGRGHYAPGTSNHLLYLIKLNTTLFCVICSCRL
jgi:hypothetical protein